MSEKKMEAYKSICGIKARIEFLEDNRDRAPEWIAICISKLQERLDWMQKDFEKLD